MADIPLSQQSSFRRSSNQDKGAQVIDQKFFDKMTKTHADQKEQNKQEQKEMVDNSQPELDQAQKEIAQNTKPVAETNVELSRLNRTAEIISARIKTLSDALQNKMADQQAQEGAQKQGPTPEVEQSTSDALADFVEDQVERTQPKEPEVVPKALPDTTTEGEQVVPKKEKEKKKEEEEPKDKKYDENKESSLKGIVSKGFKSSLAVSDKISNMLFKYTISSLAETAKMAALIFSVILGIDLIRIHFKYWTDLFQKSFEDFTNKIGAWGPILDQIFTSIDYIRNAWETGDWASLALAIAKALGGVLEILGSTILLGIGKLTAGIMRAMGFDEAAADVEGSSIQQYQQHTDAQLKEADQKKLAEYQSNRIDKGKTASEGGFFSFLRPEERHKLGLLSDEEFKQIKAEQASGDKLRNIPKDQRVDTIAQINETSAALRRYKFHAEAASPERPNDAKRLDQSYKDIQTRLADPKFNNAPEVKAELQKQLDAITNDFKKKTQAVKPAPAATKPEAQTANRISQNQAKAAVPQNANAQGTMNVNTNIVKQNKQINVQAPITSTTAPGVYGATKTN